jgi:hypothetical protein
MKKLLLLSIIGTFGHLGMAQDTCLEAVPVTEGIYTVAGINEGDVPLPVCSSGGTGATGGSWYTYTPSETLLLTITTDLPGTGATDTRLQVYVGVCDNFTCVGGDDDGGSGLTSFLSFQANEGTTYYIAFDNRYSSGGFDFQLIETDLGDIPFGFTSSSISTIGSSIAVVDMNGDFLDDIVSTSSSQIRIQYQQPDGSFETVTMDNDPVPYTASWSISAGDIDGNGYNDLQYGNGSGVAYMFANDDGTAYTPVYTGEYVFSQRGNMVDLNNDGHLDAFMCHDVQPNVYYINDGTGGLTFFQGGMGDTPDGGNYGSVFVDYNNDCLPDLFIAKCRGAGSPASINQMHMNNGDGTFTEVSDDIGLADGVQTWSSAWADFDNDGDMDVFVGASSFSAGGHKLMRNDDGVFTDVTDGSGFDTFGSTSIEWITRDFDNDGYMDIIGAGNTLWFNNGDFTFSSHPVTLSNGATGDLNNDGFIDIVRSNAIYYNNTNNNNWLKIITVGTASNKNGIGARIELTSNLGTQMRDVRAGDGFKYMSSLVTHFGLGEDEEIKSINICWPSGITQEITGAQINTTITVVEEDLTTGSDEVSEPEFLVFPNPATEMLYISTPGELNRQDVTIFSVAGQVVQQQSLINDVINIAALPAGMYVLRLEIDGKPVHHKFMKR